MKYLLMTMLCGCGMYTDCGTITEKYRDHSSMSYEHIVYYSDSLHRYVDRKVSVDIYAKYQVGSKICFP